MIKIIVIRYRIIKITVIVIIQLIIQYLRHMLFRQGQWIFDQLYFFRFYRFFLEIRWLFLREFLGLQILYFQSAFCGSSSHRNCLNGLRQHPFDFPQQFHFVR